MMPAMSRPMLRLALLVTCSLWGVRAATAADAPPSDVPAAIRVPAGAKLLTHLRGTGAQVYKCTASGTAFAWTLQKPDATLQETSGAPAGTHGAGPSWTAKDGSTVNGKKVSQADAPAADAVPWLLLQATSTAGKGRFTDVTYIQRLRTKGGKAPAAGCDAGHAGAETRASYSADYYFYSGGSAAAPAPAPAKP
jgi:hypothetical protein